MNFIRRSWSKQYCMNVEAVKQNVLQNSKYCFIFVGFLPSSGRKLRIDSKWASSFNLAGD